MANTENHEVCEKAANIDQSLLPKKAEERTVGPLGYVFMWIGDGINLGNMTLGASLVVAGLATMNIYQTFAAALIAIGIISTVFALNDRVGYRTGIPYVVQLRMSFGAKGAIISSLLRGIPAVVWYGFQSWIGATALNEIVKVFSGHTFDNIFICFLALQAIQIVLSLYGFHAIKWVEILISLVVIAALIYVFIILLQPHHLTKITDTWVNTPGTWGLPFFGFIMMFLGNYAAIFLSAADYSRELKTGISDGKRGFLYFLPIVIAYGFVLTIGVMLASATGNTNPVQAFAIIVENDYITVAVSAFIVLGAIAVNMVANIVPPAYVITLITKMKYKPAVVLTGLLAIAACPWVLVDENSAKGLQIFILTYSAFLGPIVAILLLEYYVLRKQQVDVQELYNTSGQFAGFNKAAIIAMLIGAGAAFIEVNLAWIVGFIVGGVAYMILTKVAFLDSPFRKGTIFEDKQK
ncbi:NCS1 family transporter [Wohlfahrtiimonas larvae]|uniref:NCS1 family transporter n=1 Tax=Wohlfahrtiimonas larvae TaxID=1157986 RepID=A0ABP9MSK1_9GAMM|nr:NCS1 family transporter [Wohlfahrtiimonas larvae]